MISPAWRIGGSRWRRLPWLGAVLLGVACLWLGGCGTAPPRRPGAPEFSREEQQQADRLFQQLQMEHSAHQDRRTLELAYELIDHYRPYARNDEVMLLAVRSAQRLGDLAVGRRLVDEFTQWYPASPHYDSMLDLGSELAAAATDTFAAADMLVRRYDRLPAGSGRDAIAEQAAVLLQRLPAENLSALAQLHPLSGLRPFIGFLQTQRLLEEGRQQEAEHGVAALQQVAPDSEWLVAAEKLLQEPGYLQSRLSPRMRGAAVAPNLVGILCPLTGRYAVLGNAFYDGALLALKAINRLGWRQFELKVEDSGADPVTSVIAARKLAGQEGTIAIVGSLLSTPTVAAAVVADGYRVPFVSPTATNERVWEIGPAVFQTNLTGLLEARLLAQLGTRLLLKERFAILYPDTRAGASSMQTFAEEVRASGGRLVAAASFVPEDTDFRRPLAEIKQGRPEVVYIDATVDQMILIGPQLDFYRLGALIMGPSSWSSPKLLRAAGSIMERAIFPSDTALFPNAWLSDFQAAWHPEHLPDEASPLALRAYQATRLVLETLAEGQIESREALAAALAERIVSRQVQMLGPEALASAVRMFHDGQIVPFPVELFSETWQPEPSLPFDSALSDSLPTQDLR
jgi:branched-chain amino acid transport system substrate-binding protein